MSKWVRMQTFYSFVFVVHLPTPKSCHPMILPISLYLCTTPCISLSMACTVCVLQWQYGTQALHFFSHHASMAPCQAVVLVLLLERWVVWWPHKKHSPRDEGRRNICFITLLMHWAIVLNNCTYCLNVLIEGSILRYAALGSLLYTKCQRMHVGCSIVL